MKAIYAALVATVVAGCTTVDPTRFYWNVSENAWIYADDPSIECTFMDNTGRAPICYQFARTKPLIPRFGEFRTGSYTESDKQDKK